MVDASTGTLRSIHRAVRASWSNLIRPAKLGLKNWLFIGNAEAGQASPVLYTLIANYREQRIEAERYFEEAIPRTLVTGTQEQAAELTPGSSRR